MQYWYLIKTNRNQDHVENTKWLDELMPRQKTCIKQIVRKMMSYYGKDNIDILHLRPSVTDKIEKIYIGARFKNAPIENNDNAKHVISDIVFYYEILLNHQFDKFEIGNTFLHRFSAREDEIINDYFHSHVDTKYSTIPDIEGWSQATNNYNQHYNENCLGTSEMNQIIIKINVAAKNFEKYPDGIPENLCFQLVYMIKRFIEWESLEGTPYRYIKNISSVGVRQERYVRQNVNDISTIADIYIDSNHYSSFSHLIKISMDNACVAVHKNSLEEFIKQPSSTSNDFLNRLSYVLINGQKCKVDATDSTPGHLTTSKKIQVMKNFPGIFKGEVINFEVIELEDNPDDNADNVIKIDEYFLKVLSLKLELKYQLEFIKKLN